MEKQRWSLAADLEPFDLGESGVKPGTWRGREALYFEGLPATPVLLREEVPTDCYRLQAEIAIPGPYGFAGIAFGARDHRNYELVYISPGSGARSGDIQYDPIMNGSSTWQIYNGSAYQASAPVPPGEWVKLTLEVDRDRVAICVGEDADPQLVVSKLQHGRAAGRIGIWANLPGYIRNLSMEPLRAESEEREPAANTRLAEETFVTEWLVSKPYSPGESPESGHAWTKATVEENGAVNINRLYPAEVKGTSVQALSTFSLAEEKETVLTFGFSDRLRLWVNDAEVYEGEWKWAPPESDGRIRSDHAFVPVRWRAGINTIRAEITNLERKFGWGLSVKTGLYDVQYMN